MSETERDEARGVDAEAAEVEAAEVEAAEVEAAEAETAEAVEGRGEGGARAPGSRWARLWRDARVPLALFAVALVVMGLLAWERVKRPSPDTHFVYLANAMLAGSLELQRPPPHGNDWASYTSMRLKSGQEVRGVWLDTRTRRFKTLDGAVMVIDRAEEDPRARKTRTFVSFPPAPAVLMLPLAAVWGYGVNDVWFTLFFGALNVALTYVLLRRLARAGLTGRSARDNLWLTALMGFGTVHLWCSVLGQVWFTALVVGVTFTLLYMMAAMEARRPFWAGVCLALAFATRTPLLFGAVFFMGFWLFPGGALRRGDWGRALKDLARFAAPCLLVGGLLLWANHARFGSLVEFGHSYLASGQIDRIRKYGLFNIHFLSKNLSAALTLLPRVQAEAPYVIVSRHGMSLLLTTPAWVYLFLPEARRDARERLWWRLTWATVAAIAIPGLLYQNTGYEQFGYRFSLDYSPYLVALLALGRRPLSWVFKALVLVGIAVNTFGAITFKRFEQFYMPGATFFDPD